MKTKNIQIHTLDNKNEVIEDYLPIDFVNNMMFHNTEISITINRISHIEENSFFFNGIIPSVSGINLNEIKKVSEKLLEIFPNDNNDLIHEIIFLSQFNLGTVSFLTISDYSLIEFQGYYIFFHLSPKLGITITSMWRKSDLRLKKPLSVKKKIKLQTH